jgi:hypothetical protein
MFITVFTYDHHVKCSFGIVYYVDICHYLLIIKCFLFNILILLIVHQYITAVLHSDAEYVKWSGHIDCV